MVSMFQYGRRPLYFVWFVGDSTMVEHRKVTGSLNLDLSRA